MTKNKSMRKKKWVWVDWAITVRTQINIRSVVVWCTRWTGCLKSLLCVLCGQITCGTAWLGMACMEELIDFLRETLFSGQRELWRRSSVITFTMYSQWDWAVQLCWQRVWRASICRPGSGPGPDRPLGILQDPLGSLCRRTRWWS